MIATPPPPLKTTSTIHTIILYTWNSITTYCKLVTSHFVCPLPAVWEYTAVCLYVFDPSSHLSPPFSFARFSGFDKEGRASSFKAFMYHHERLREYPTRGISYILYHLIEHAIHEGDGLYSPTATPTIAGILWTMLCGSWLVLRKY